MGPSVGRDGDGVVDIAIAATVVVDVGLLHDVTCGAGLWVPPGRGSPGGQASSPVSGSAMVMPVRVDVAGVFDRDGVADDVAGSIHDASVTAVFVAVKSGCLRDGDGGAGRLGGVPRRSVGIGR